MNEKQFSHISRSNQPTMVDVSQKSATLRTARARTIVQLPEALKKALSDGEINSPKGPVFQTAIVAGTMACKKTSELIPFCHPIGLDSCSITITVNDQMEVVIECETSVVHKTGVEMEALTGASVAALTIYDMCKGVSHDIIIQETRLIEKRGGKSDYSEERNSGQ
jgi:cyclic pyranopterin phosphate synthase